MSSDGPISMGQAAKLLDFQQRKFREQREAAEKHGFIIKNFATEIPVEKIDWLWRNYVPRGSITNIQGPPDKGKTTMVSDIVARLTRGESMPCEANPGPREPMDALWFTNEESPSRHIAPRLLRAGADMARCHLIDFDPTKPNSWLTMPSRAAAFEAMVTEMRGRGCNLGLLVVDGLSSIIDRKMSANNEQDVRVAIGTLSKSLERLNLACIAIRHQNKGQGGIAINKGSGSIGFTAVARAEFLVGDDPDDSTLRVMAKIKANLTNEANSLRFEFVPRDGGVVIGWLGECETTAEDINAAAENRAKGKASPKQIETAAAQIESAMVQCEGDGIHEVPEPVLRDMVCKHYGVPGNAFTRGMAVLKAAKKFKAIPAKVGGGTVITRWRSQWQQKGGQD